MKRKKITAIMAVIMMAAGLSACSQSNAKLEGKSGIVKDEASKTEGDTGVVDQAPATYVQAEYVNKNDIISTDDTATIDNYWTEGKENERYHYVLGAGESVTSEVGYIIQDEWMSEDSKYIYYCIEGIDSKTNDKVQKYFKLEL